MLPDVKGNAAVVMDTEEYKKKMRKILKEINYKQPLLDSTRYLKLIDKNQVDAPNYRDYQKCTRKEYLSD